MPRKQQHSTNNGNHQKSSMEIPMSHFVECPRCTGQMVKFSLNDFFQIFWACKCIQCGEIIDKVIIANRQLVANAKKNGHAMPSTANYVHHKGGTSEGTTSQGRVTAEEGD